MATPDDELTDLRGVQLSVIRTLERIEASAREMALWLRFLGIVGIVVVVILVFYFVDILVNGRPYYPY